MGISDKFVSFVLTNGKQYDKIIVKTFEKSIC